ncbi:HTH-type transcriptional repressor PurR [Streptomyces tendae]
MSDGPAGVRGEAWDERNTSVLLPSASALAATWDEALVERLGGLLAAEALRKGVDVLLAPTLNLHRSPLGGRHFECLSEDPELTGRIGAALVRGVQAHGVAATAKHYVANDSETDRLTVDVRVGERALREVYLAPFEAAVAAGVRLVMAGYNAVNGTTMTANALLTDPLKSEWGFDGVVVSDWGAVRGTVDTARAGLDLAMPGPDGPWGEALARAVTDGDVPEAAVDDKARRLLRLAAWLGALGGHDAPPPGAPDRPSGAQGPPLPPDAEGPSDRVASGRAPSSGVERVLGPVLPPGAGFASASAPSPGAEVWPGGVSPSGAEGPSGPAALPGAGDSSPSARPPGAEGSSDRVAASGAEGPSGRAPSPGARRVPGPVLPPGAGFASASALAPGVEVSSGRVAVPGAGTSAVPDPACVGDARALARRAVAAGTVLLDNKGVLPFDPESLGTVAVIGAHAARTRTQGGGSAGVFPPDEVSVLRTRRMHPVLMFAETPEARQEVVAYLRQGGADGALVVSTHPDDPLPALLAGAGLAAVLFARPGRPVPLSHVDLAHRDGGRLAAEHLLERGCGRIATVTGPLAVAASQERLAGFRDTLARHGHPYVPVAEGGFTVDSGMAAMTSLLAEHPDTDGVFTANDLMAQGAVQVLRDRGRRVPQDVAVVGFDDSGVAVTCRPRLTTVRQPVEEMAAAMARLLDDHITGARTEPTSLIFDPELVVRDSA